MSNEQGNPYTYADLLNDLKELNEEELKRTVLGWREEESFKISSLMNDRQPYYHDEEHSYSETDYNSMNDDGKSNCELLSETGITVLIEEF